MKNGFNCLSGNRYLLIITCYSVKQNYSLQFSLQLPISLSTRFCAQVDDITIRAKKWMTSPKYVHTDGKTVKPQSDIT